VSCVTDGQDQERRLSAAGRQPVGTARLAAFAGNVGYGTRMRWSVYLNGWGVMTAIDWGPAGQDAATRSGSASQAGEGKAPPLILPPASFFLNVLPRPDRRNTPLWAGRGMPRDETPARWTIFADPPDRVQPMRSGRCSASQGQANLIRPMCPGRQVSDI